MPAELNKSSVSGDEPSAILETLERMIEKFEASLANTRASIVMVKKFTPDHPCFAIKDDLLARFDRVEKGLEEQLRESQELVRRYHFARFVEAVATALLESWKPSRESDGAD